jgi:hypothetical protein
VRRKLGVGEGHVTLTDEAGLIVAVAVLMRAPKRTPPPARRKRKRKRGAQMNLLVFDIETVPDVELGRRVLGLEGLA